MTAGEKITAFAVVVVAAICLAQCMGGDGDSGDAAGDGGGGKGSGSSQRAGGGHEAAESSQRAAGGHEVAVSSGDVGEWPFTVAGGVLRCRAGGEVTFEPDGGREYAVNGTAKGGGYPAMGPIWADDEELGAGLKVDVSEVLAMGLDLC